MTAEFQSQVLDFVEQSKRLIDEKQAAIDASVAERSAYLAGVSGVVQTLVNRGVISSDQAEKMASDLSDPQTALDLIHLLAVKRAAVEESKVASEEVYPSETFGKAVAAIDGETKQASSTKKDEAFIATWLSTSSES